MSKSKIISSFNLQLFSEGGSAATAGGNGAIDGGGNAEVKTAEKMLATSKADNSEVANSQNNAENSATKKETEKADRNAEFKKLIQGEYKDLYEAEMKNALGKRLKGSKETADRLKSVEPLLGILSESYGIDAKDIPALIKAVEEDNSLFEKQALEKGMDVDSYRRMRVAERQADNLRQRESERIAKENADRIYAGWMKEAEETKAIYPGFDLETEMNNPEFLRLIKDGVPIKTAYKVLHDEEITAAAMKYAADTAEKQVTDKVMANGARPTENGLSSRAAATVKPDVSKMTKAQRAEINARVLKGERIIL